MRKLRVLLIFVMVITFICGFLVLMYPHVYGQIVDQKIIADANSFLQRTDLPEPEPGATVHLEDGEKEKIHSKLRDEMAWYNHSIWLEHQAGLSDPWAYEQPSFTLGEYGFEDEIFGVIQIPALNVTLPIYLGATHQHMNDGAAHLSQTSLPIGGTNTNCVIAAHNGWGGASYFRHIPDLQAGDEIIITNPWETLHYVVSESNIIEPNDIEEILIQDGRELVTLLTCYPYGTGGRQRYLVICERSDTYVPVS